MPARIPSLDPIFFNRTIDWDNSSVAQHVLGDRAGDSFLIMDPGHRDRGEFPKPDKKSFSQPRAAVEVNKTEAQGPWTVIEGSMDVNRTYKGVGGVKDAFQIENHSVSFKATFCFDVMV